MSNYEKVLKRINEAEDFSTSFNTHQRGENISLNQISLVSCYKKLGMSEILINKIYFDDVEVPLSEKEQNNICKIFNKK